MLFRADRSSAFCRAISVAGSCRPVAIARSMPCSISPASAPSISPLSTITVAKRQVNSSRAAPKSARVFGVSSGLLMQAGYRTRHRPVSFNRTAILKGFTGA